MHDPGSDQGSSDSIPQGKKTRNEYWSKVHFQPWRTQAEIGVERQRSLDQRRGEIAPDIDNATYPFKDIEPALSRAAIEWLLATYDAAGIIGPIDWDDARHRNCEGIDLRGITLRDVSLDESPRARMRGGLFGAEFDRAASEHSEHRERAGLIMVGGSLRHAHLEGAYLRYANLAGVSLFEAHLEAAEL
jgi:uncharacterized protein YjbI with pentapeptide repeats